MKIENKSPAFQFYPDKWLVDTRRLSLKAKGFYIDLLSQMWQQSKDHCSIPNDPPFIASEVGVDQEIYDECMAEIQNIHRPLLILETNRFISRGLQKEAFKQEKRRLQLQENGAKGGRPKKDKPKGSLEESKKKPGAGNQNESLPLPSSFLISFPSIKNKELEERFNNTFNDFLEMRKKIRKPPTNKAVDLILKKLPKMSLGNANTAILILEQSIESSWQGIFPLKENGSDFDPDAYQKIKEKYGRSRTQTGN